MTRVLDPKDAGFMVGEKASKNSLVRVIRRFSDITNTQLSSRSTNKDETSKPISSSAKEFVEQLQKENAALLKLLADRNKIIELSNDELQKLRFNWQRAHQQNWQLAHVNSQMLAELNIARDKIKTERHEHGCLAAMLKAKNSELEKKVNELSQQISSSSAIPKKGPGQSERLTGAPQTNILSNHNRRRHSEYPSSGNSTVTKQDRVKGRTDNKRICLRRPYGTVKSLEPTESKDLFEIEDAKFPSPILDEDCYISLDSLSGGGDRSADCEFNNVGRKTESKEKEAGPKSDTSQRCQTKELPRSSLGRPVRRAAEKISSYREIPINIKMRRSD